MKPDLSGLKKNRRKTPGMGRTPLIDHGSEEEPAEPARHNVMAAKKSYSNYRIHRPSRYRLKRKTINDRNNAGEIKLVLWISKDLYEQMLLKNQAISLSGDTPKPITPQERIRTLIKRWTKDYPHTQAPPTTQSKLLDPTSLLIDKTDAYNRTSRERKRIREKQAQATP